MIVKIEFTVEFSDKLKKDDVQDRVDAASKALRTRKFTGKWMVVG